MKANEAPEKIYLFENPISNEPDYRWLSKRSDNEDIEYARTDAFIEKVGKYFTEKFIKDVSVLVVGPVHINFDAAFSNFIKYMKGE